MRARLRIIKTNEILDNERIFRDIPVNLNKVHRMYLDIFAKELGGTKMNELREVHMPEKIRISTQ